ncbi:MAG: hypothetical protein P0S95_00715 [Rhabdochlamydiaceae bacterium]|nr:hypothetical protein [Candidatus Amphrikana amoebophyrae]
MKKTLLSAICCSLMMSANSVNLPSKVTDLDVRMKDPTYENDVLFTTGGAVIESPGFRVQARDISFDHANGIIKAQGDLMVAYNERIFIGDTFEYNIKEKHGVLINGKTYDNLWIIGGDKIEFFPDKSIKVTKAFITTSETDPTEYDITTKELTISEEGLLKAKNVQFRFAHVPIFYLPFYRMNLKKNKSDRIKYRVTWDSGQGPKFSMRYRVYSWTHTDLFLRFDFRVNRGFGGAIESKFKAKEMDLKFQTKNYIAHDTFFADQDPNKRRTRWRIQGFGEAKSQDKMTEAVLKYDWISDKNMPQDFKTDDFELNTAERTELLVNHIHPVVVSDLYIRPNINTFQGFKQQLPTIKVGLHPLEFGTSKIMMDNNFSASFLDYDYAKDLQRPLSGFRSMRVETNQRVYRPFNFKALTITPDVGYQGVAYSNNPNNQSILTSILRYGVEASSSFSKKFTTFGHVVKPYAKFNALRPMKNHSHYIFDLNDGYEAMKQLKVGVVNDFYMLQNMGQPRLSLDIYGYQFFGTPQLRTGIPKLGAKGVMNFDRVQLNADVIYNNLESVYDKANFGLKWTMSQFFAVGLDFLRRSRFYYRKDNNTNFILDTNVAAQDLLNTPISDQRNLFVAKAELNIVPNWTVRIQSNFGWAREQQPSYNNYKIDLYNMVTTNWKFRISYMHQPDTDQVSFGLSLVNY